MIRYTFAAFFICFTVAMCRSVCDPGWRFSPHSKKCYKFFNRAISWAQAEFNCLYLGGHHLSIHSLNENRFTREIAHDASELWLGSAQFHHSDKYEWSDHTRFDFENWKNDVRPNNNWNQPCTKMNITTGEWFPSCCRKLAPYICQKNPRTTTLYIDSEENTDDLASAIEKNSILKRRWRFLL